MILVRDIFQVKFGHMDQVLAALRAQAESRAGSDGPVAVSRVLTDLSGSYFTLVMETRAESIDAYWSRLRAAFADSDRPEGDSIMSYVESGRREFFTIEWEA